MAQQLRERLAEGPAAGINPTVVEVACEDLPFDDGSFDTVVGTLVFCTVDEPAPGSAEARRVLVEGGRLLYLDMCAAPARPRALAGPAAEALGPDRRRLHPQPPADQAIADAGFWIDGLERGQLPKAPARPAADPRGREAALPASGPARGSSPSAAAAVLSCQGNSPSVLTRGSAFPSTCPAIAAIFSCEEPREETMNHFRSTPRPRRMAGPPS